MTSEDNPFDDGQAVAWPRLMDRVRRELAAAVRPGSRFLFVDDANWAEGAILPGREAIPFLERGGNYWGRPKDDESAVREFERLREAGLPYVVVAQPCFWWLDHFAGFRLHIESLYRRVVANDLLIVFEAAVHSSRSASRERDL